MKDREELGEKRGPRRQNMTAAAQKEIVQLIKLRGSVLNKYQVRLFCRQILAGYIGLLSIVKDNSPFCIVRPDILNGGSGSQLTDPVAFCIGLGADVQGVGGFIDRSCIFCRRCVGHRIGRSRFCHKLHRGSGCCRGILCIAARFKQPDNKKQKNDTKNRNQKF